VMSEYPRKQFDIVIETDLSLVTDEYADENLEYCQAAMRVHVEGTYNVLRAAADFGGKRVLYASSVSATQGYSKDEMIGPEHRWFGGGPYCLTKGLGEEVCRHFYEFRRVPVTILRLGNVFIPELSGHPQQRGAHPSRVHVDDVARAFRLVLERSEPAFSVVHIVGEHPRRQWDLSAARELYGWEPTVRFGEDGQPLT